MPIIDINPTCPKTAAEWRYIPNEDIDLSDFMNIETLFITAASPPRTFLYEDCAYPPSTLPSIAALFPNLIYLRVVKPNSITRFGYSQVGNYSQSRWGAYSLCYIGGITDIPVTVKHVVIEDAYITDITNVFRHGPELEYFALKNNFTDVSVSLPLPNKIVECLIERTTFVDALTFPSSIQKIGCLHCEIPRMYGLDKAPESLSLVIEECDTPYDNYIIDRGFMEPCWHRHHFVNEPDKSTTGKVTHITRLNAVLTYLDFGSIPKRIPVSPDNIENPIVLAMNLSSNYPRRMAEFIAITEVTTVFANDNEFNDEEEDLPPDY